jgi:ubiquinone/menaquinone biosynthesis C-methylase UbiE
VSQREVFLDGEGDAWYQRNSASAGQRRLPEGDPLLTQILALSAPAATEGASILEIGCGEGIRLGWLKENRGCTCYGVDPSARAVTAASQRGVLAQTGTAEQLPFEDATFDVVAFGFCLYLCDREDLFRIACEADRVLKSPGWLVIYDFFHPTPTRREYHHRAGLFSYKMDYRSLFTWHPGYATFAHKVFHHTSHDFTDDRNEWVAVSVLRKQLS